MPATIPCPNPTCAHQFTADALRGATSLTCPLCGHSFAFRAAAPAAPAAPIAKPAPAAKKPSQPGVPAVRPAAPPPTAPPVARPVAPPPAAARPAARPAARATPQAVPAAQPVRPPVALAVPIAQPAPPPPVPVAAPVAAPLVPAPARPEPDDSDELAFDTRRKSIVSLSRGRSSAGTNWLMPVLVVGFLTVVVGGGLVVLNQVRQAWAPDDVKAPDTTFKDYNFTLTAPKSPWKQDSDLQEEWMFQPPGGVLLWKRTGPTGYIAVYYRDYPDRLPPMSELLDTIMGKLRQEFDKLIWEARAPAAVGNLVTNGEVAGKPALVVDFAGDFHQVPYSGECAIVAHRGYVYWLVNWAPEEQKAQVAGDWEQFRTGFKTLNQREGWVPRTRPTRDLKGDGYTLAVASDLWRDQGLTIEEPGVKYRLNGFDYANPRQKFNALQAATLQVEERDKQPDLDAAAKAARDQVSEQLKAEDLGEFTVQDAEGPNDEPGIESSGGIKGRLLRLRVKTPGRSLDRFFMLGVFPVGERTLVIAGHCEWKRRDLYETELLQVMRSIK